MAITQVPNSLLTQPVNHNILINPSFTVFQRAGTTLSGDWGVDHDVNSYGPDRWELRGLNLVGGGKAQSSTDSSSGINKLVVEHDGATDVSYTFQYIEAVNLLGLYGKEMTFSFSYSDVGGSGIPQAKVKSYDSSDTAKFLFDAVPTSLGDNRWSCTVTLTTEDGTIPDPSERGMQVTIHPNEQNTAPDEWSAWETKLEAGSVATPFIARPYSEELVLCQRYFQAIEAVEEGTRVAQGGWAGTVNFECFLPIFTPLCSSPSVNLSTGWNVTKNGVTTEFDSTTVYTVLNKRGECHNIRMLFRFDTPEADKGSEGQLRANLAYCYIWIEAEL